MYIFSYLLSGWTLLIILLSYLLYKWSTATYNFFKDRNVPFDKPVPFFGNSWGMMVPQAGSIFEATQRSYMKFKGKKLYGIFAFREPQLILRDPELIKQITVKNFDHFVNHRAMLEEDVAPLFMNSIFFLKDQKWKDMRSTLSPAFTGSKMRILFQLVEETCQTAIEYLQKESEKGPLILEFKDFFTRYTNDVIATTAFGIKVNSLKDKNNKFYEMGKAVTNYSIRNMLKFLLYFSIRKITKFFGIDLFENDHTKYFKSLVLDTMKYRKEHNIFRPDMIQLLMEARQGKLKASTDCAEDSNGLTTFADTGAVKSHNREWSDIEIAAQCYLFFVAGFETTSILMCFCAHELMENPDIQQKLLAEIDEVNYKLNGKPLSYEILQKMKYLDMVISETLRKWPSAIAIDRVCSKPFTIIDDVSGNIIPIARNDLLSIPVAGIHRDPEFYQEPNKFDPERFNDENKGNIKPFTYLPFGSGPRVCIASRLALMESKAIIFRILSKFSFEVSEKSTIPLQLSKRNFSLSAKDGFWIHLKPRC